MIDCHVDKGIRMHRSRMVVALAASLALLVAACDPGEEVDVGVDDDEDEEEVDVGGGVLVAALSAEPDQLDPHLTTASPSFTVNEQIYNTLVNTTPDLTFEPALATDWEESDDQLTWTFELRDDVTFHNGRELTADDVVFTYERIMDPDVGAANAFRLANVDAVTAVDDHTVEISLAEPSPNLLANVSNYGLAIVPEEAVEDGSVESSPVGTGPFMFVNYTEGSNLELEANPDYWGGVPGIDGVLFRFIAEGTVALTGLETGEIHWTNNVPPADIEAVIENPDIEADAVPSTDYWYFSTNLEVEPFDDPQVREALAWGFDRETIVEAAQFGAATVNQTAIPADSFWHHDYAPYGHEPDRARQLLDDAGIDEISTSIMVTDEFPHTVEAAQVLEAQWSEIGVNLTIDSVEFATWLDRNTEGDWEVRLLGWVGNIDPDDYYYRQHHSQGPDNVQGYENAEVDQLLDQARTDTDENARKALYDRATELIVDDNSYTYLYNPDIVEAWGPAVRGFEIRADGKTVFEGVTLDQ